MHLGRQSRPTKPRSGRVRAAALLAARSHLASPKRLLVLGLVCCALSRSDRLGFGRIGGAQCPPRWRR